jgi:anti-sigma-K factor RskA
MTTPQEDIANARALGRAEGALGSMETRMDKIEDLVTEGFRRMDERLARIEAKEIERRGAWRSISVVSSIFTALAAWVAAHFLK